MKHNLKNKANINSLYYSLYIFCSLCDENTTIFALFEYESSRLLKLTDAATADDVELSEFQVVMPNA